MSEKSEMEQLKGWDKMVAWYASKSYAVGIIYSLGASIVIVGALFKIMHWPGAGIVLTCGMCTEAFLFVMGIFEKPHATYNWENVFPQVIGHEVKPLAEGSLKGGMGGAATVAPVAAAPVAGNPVVGAAAGIAGATNLSAKDIEGIEKGLKNLAETAQNLNTLGSAAVAADKLAANIQAATVATEQFAGAAEAANVYAANMAAISQNVAALNSLYQVQLQNVQAVGNAAAEFQQNATQLAKQVSDLNNVYGNMLSALA